MKCSLVSPAFSINRLDPESLQQVCAAKLGTDKENIEVYALVPLEDVPHATEVAFQLKHSSFSLCAVEETLVQRDQLSQQLQRSRDALASCMEELQRLQSTQVPTDSNAKLAKLEEDNKKLRRLLK